MNQKDFDLKRQSLHSKAETIVERKRTAYTMQNDDVLHNFKTTAERCGITPLQAWAVHFEKQVSATMNYCKGGDPGEPIEGRFCDLQNYLELGYALMLENENPLVGFETSIGTMSPAN